MRRRFFHAAKTLLFLLLFSGFFAGSKFFDPQHQKQTANRESDHAPSLPVPSFRQEVFDSVQTFPRPDFTQRACHKADQNRHREIRVFYGIEHHIRNVSFKDMYAPGGLRISGNVDEAGEVTVSVRAVKDALVCLKVRQSERFTQKLAAGESITLKLTDGKLVRI